MHAHLSSQHLIFFAKITIKYGNLKPVILILKASCKAILIIITLSPSFLFSIPFTTLYYLTKNVLYTNFKDFESFNRLFNTLYHDHHHVILPFLFDPRYSAKRKKVDIDEHLLLAAKKGPQIVKPWTIDKLRILKVEN